MHCPILGDGGLVAADIAERFAAWFKSWPVDVGNTCRRGIARYINHGTLAGPFNEGDAGNGAAMRVAPVALATLADGSLLERWAVEQGHITHNHPLSDAACVLIGRLIHLGCTGQPLERLQREAEVVVARFPDLPLLTLSRAVHRVCGRHDADRSALLLVHAQF